VLYKGVSISQVSYTTTCYGLSASFANTVLQIFDSASQTYLPGTYFKQQVTQLPQFKVALNDIYQNPVAGWPSGWSMTLILTGSELSYANRLQFSQSSFSFTLDPANNQPD